MTKDKAMYIIDALGEMTEACYRAEEERDEARAVAKEMLLEWVWTPFPENPRANEDYEAYLKRFPWLASDPSHNES